MSVPPPFIPSSSFPTVFLSYTPPSRCQHVIDSRATAVLSDVRFGPRSTCCRWFMSLGLHVGTLGKMSDDTEIGSKFWGGRGVADNDLLA